MITPSWPRQAGGPGKAELQVVPPPIWPDLIQLPECYAANAVTMIFARAFRSDPLRHDGVRPFNIWGLRVFYLLMLLFVAPTAWRVLLSHEGPWLPLSAVAWAVWATYPVLALFGLFKPLRWLPILFFALGYKTIWLAFVAVPLWRAGTMEGSSVQPIAESFPALPLLALAIPWGYAWRTYGLEPQAAKVRAGET